MTNKRIDRLKYGLRNVFDSGEVFSGISVSNEAINVAIDKGNMRLCKVLMEIAKERIEWWKECDINKYWYAKEVSEDLENFYKENEIKADLVEKVEND
jgi:hypothetical protein